MKVIYDLGKDKLRLRNAVVAVGVFDGIHRGHQALIECAVRRARALKGQAVVMTFWPHPVCVLHPDVYLPMIVSLSYRLKLIAALNVDTAIVVKFTKAFSGLSPEKFIKDYLVKFLRPKEVFVGDDFRFGQNRSGSLKYFKEEGRRFGFKVDIVHPVKGDDKKISSTLIRQLIAGGKLKKAKELLGREVSILGKVAKGDGRGRTLGFKTANIYPDCEVIPPLGVYAVWATISGKRWKAMANVGRRPSFKSYEDGVVIEVHIFDFNQNIYGKEIVVEFLDHIRDEKAFSSRENLVEQLHRDEVFVRALFAKK